MNPGQMNPSQDELLMEYLLEMGALQPEEQQLGRQRSMIDALRQQSQVPTATMNAGGRGYQPARSPLEMLAPAIGQGLASYKERGVDTAAKALKDRRIGALGNIRSRVGAGSAAQFPTRPLPGEDTQPLL